MSVVIKLLLRGTLVCFKAEFIRFGSRLYLLLARLQNRIVVRVTFMQF